MCLIMYFGVFGAIVGAMLIKIVFFILHFFYIDVNFPIIGHVKSMIQCVRNLTTQKKF